MKIAEIQQIGPFRVKRFIAEGGMAWVFEVVDTRYEGFEVVRALKMLKPEAAAGEEFQRFLTEASVLAGIDHPNLVTIYEPPVKDEATGCFYYTMAFIEGPTLSNYQSERGELTEPDVLRLFEELLGGLAELHRRKIVHRDIKPANVLIGADGRSRLADLGIARLQESSGRTRTGFALGTVHYMSPEQARGRPVGAPSDVFSVGITLYEALTGRIVYDDVDDVDSTNNHDVLSYLAAMARSGEELEIDFQSAGISPTIAKVIKRACRPDPEDRYADASEMLTALGEARDRMEGGPAHGLTPRVMAIAGGGLVIALMAAVGVWWYLQSVEVERVTELVTQASALDGELTTLIERSATLDPQPPQELVEALRRSSAESKRYLADANADLSDENIASARSNGERATRGLTGICERILGEYVEPLSKERIASARATIDGLRVTGVDGAFPDEFAALETMIPADLAAIDPGCGGANAHLDRVELAGNVNRQADALGTKLAAWLITEIAAIRDQVLGAQTRAEADPVEAPPYAEALASAVAALEEGDTLRDADDLLAARTTYQEATANYEEAVAIAPAARARAKALDVESQLDAKGTPVRPETTRILTVAHGYYREGSWQEATGEFQSAAARMSEDLDRGAVLVTVNAMRESATARRTEAVTAGAERSAAQELGEADRAMESGATALVGDSLTEALTHFQKAERLFAVARDTSARALEDGRDALRAAERDIQPCNDLKAPDARGPCNSAGGALDRGRTALASLDAPAALTALAKVSAEVQRGIEANQSWAIANQVAPAIVSRTPADRSVAARRNQRLEFSVAAEDGNGDPITYEWSFEGNRLPESGASLRFAPQRPGTLQVAALDSTGSSTPATWVLELLNTPPRASVTPTTESVGLTIGGYRTFRASLEDPDGDAVDAVWKLDGKQVATGDSYRFTGEKEGRHDLEFVATDTGGERTVVRRSIQVAKRADPAPPITKPPEPTPAPPIAKPPEPTPAPPIAKAPTPPAPTPPAPRVSSAGVRMPSDVAISEDWRAGIITALGRYRKAIVGKNMSALQDVWIGLKMDPSQGNRWVPRYTGMFRSDKSLDVSLDVVSAFKSGDGEVTLQLKQTETRGDRRPRTRDYTMELLKRGTRSEWQITKVQ